MVLTGVLVAGARVVLHVHDILRSDASEIDLSWFAGKKCCLVTAGASAPEHLVQNLIARLQKEFGGEVEQRTLVEEDVFFDLPKSAKSLAVIG